MLCPNWGFRITAANQSTSLSSGQEVFCNHEYFLKGGPDDANHPHGQLSRFSFPDGFPFPPAFKLDVASVSQIFNAQLQPVAMDEVFPGPGLDLDRIGPYLPHPPPRRRHARWWR